MERMFVVQQHQRAEKTQFEGKPTALWAAGKGQSLPPPPEVPKKCAVVRERLDATQLEQVRERVRGGESSAAIARSMGVHASRVYSIKSRMDKPDAPAPALVRMPVVLPASPEGQRMHVLDWERRMAAYAFSHAPAGVIPRKRPKKLNDMTRKQIRQELRGHQRVHATAINCGKRPTVQPDPAAETAQKARKKAEFDTLFAGGPKAERRF